MTITRRVEYDTQLTDGAVKRLLDDEITALVIPNYYSKELATSLANKIIASQTLEHYTHELSDGETLRQEYLGVDREGFPFNMVYEQDDEAVVEEYYRAAKKNIHRIRAYTSPAITPIDKLRLELDEQYECGAVVGAFQNKKMLAGIGRVSHANMSYMSEDPPHFDALPKHFAQLDGQFAANIYLKVPDDGGELEMWDVEELSPLATVPANWREQLPPSIKLKASVGDLIIFNCRRPHAIRSFTGEPRVTMQVFIGHQQHKPLLLWN